MTSIVKYLTLAICLAGVISCRTPHPVNGKVAGDQRDPVGIVDNTGKVRWLPQESTTYPMRSPSEGRAAIYVDRQWGFIDTKGHLAVKPQYQFARDFHQGRAAVLVSGGVGHVDGPYYVLMDRECYSIGSAAFYSPPIGTSYCRWGYIDQAGKQVVSVQFSEAGDFHEGLAAVRAVSDKWLKAFGRGHHREVGYIDRDGKGAIPPRASRTHGETPPGSRSNDVCWMRPIDAREYVRWSAPL